MREVVFSGSEFDYVISFVRPTEALWNDVVTLIILRFNELPILSRLN